MSTPVRPYNLDPDFERAVTYLCATRPAFYGRLGHNLIPERLGVDACVSVMRACVAVYKETGKGPAGHEIVMQRIRNQMDAGSVTHDDYMVAKSLFDTMRGVAVDEAGISEELIPKLKEILTLEAMVKASEQAAKGEIDTSAIRDLLDEAGSVGKSDTSIGLSLGDEVFDALHQLHILPRLRTTIVEIDSLIGGGAVAGTLNFFIGGTGDGKSMALAHLAAGAMRQRKFVGCATYGEVVPAMWHARVIANLTGFPINEVLAGNERVKKRLTKMRDNGELGTLVCGEQTQGESTIVELKDWASRAEDKFKAELDLVLVDYADQMAPAKECKTDYIGMKNVYQALRSWAQERNRFPVWTASQAKARQKGDAGRILGLYDAADSTHKVRIADLVITINVDKEKNEVRYFIAKHRLGKSDMLIGPLPLDFSLGRMAPIPGLSEADL